MPIEPIGSIPTPPSLIRAAQRFQSKTGIDVLGDLVAWGAHFCLFYETKEDLLDTLVSYCKAGFQSEEYCLWIIAEPLTIEEARDALRDTVPDLDRYLADSRVGPRLVSPGWHV